MLCDIVDDRVWAGRLTAVCPHARASPRFYYLPEVNLASSPDQPFNIRSIIFCRVSVPYETGIASFHFFLRPTQKHGNRSHHRLRHRHRTTPRSRSTAARPFSAPRNTLFARASPLHRHQRLIQQTHIGFDICCRSPATPSHLAYPLSPTHLNPLAHS